LLELEQPLDAVRRQVQQSVELVAAERVAFRRALHFDESAAVVHHHVHVGFGTGILGIVGNVIGIVERGTGELQRGDVDDRGRADPGNVDTELAQLAGKNAEIVFEGEV